MTLYKAILDIYYHYGTSVWLLPQSGRIVKIQGHRYIVTVGIGRIQDIDGYMTAYKYDTVIKCMICVNNLKGSETL